MSAFVKDSSGLTSIPTHIRFLAAVSTTVAVTTLGLSNYREYMIVPCTGQSQATLQSGSTTTGAGIFTGVYLSSSSYIIGLLNGAYFSATSIGNCLVFELY